MRNEDRDRGADTPVKAECGRSRSASGRMASPLRRSRSMIKALSPTRRAADVMSPSLTAGGHLGLAGSGSASAPVNAGSSGNCKVHRKSFSTLHRSLMPGARQGTPETGAPEANDCGKPISAMAKSIVTMLTAASMYAGMELDARAESDADDVQEEDEEDEETAAAAADAEQDLAPSYGHDTGDELSAFLERSMTVDADAEADTEADGDAEADRLVEGGGAPAAAPQETEQPPPADEPADLSGDSYGEMDDDVSIVDSERRPSVAAPAATALQPLSRKSTLFEMSVMEKFAPSTDKKSSRARALAVSEKLKKTFDISDEEKFVGDFPCWLLRDVLLQGHLYLTSSHLLFFAYLPRKQGNVAASGTLGVKSYPSRLVAKRWAVLRDSTLSFYSSSTDMYFPSLTVDLRAALRAEVVVKREIIRPGMSLFGLKQPKKIIYIRLLTESKKYYFEADSEDSAGAWVTALRKHIFAARNKGNHVSLKLPLINVVDLEVTPVLESTQTLKIKIIESTESFAVDDYHLMFFSGAERAVEAIKRAIKELEAGMEKIGGDFPFGTAPDTSNSKPEDALKQTRSHRLLLSPRLRASSLYKLTHPLSSPRMRSRSQSRTSSQSGSTDSVVEKIVKYDDEDRDVPEIVLNVDGQVKQKDGDSTSTNDSDGGSETLNDAGESPKGGDLSPQSSRWGSRNLVKGVMNMTSFGITHVANLSTMWSAAPNHYDEANSLERGSEDPFLIRDVRERSEATERFQRYFSLPKDTKLIASYYAHLTKNIPVYGKVYIGDRDICFRSLLPGTNTLMILPFDDIETVHREKGFRFGYSGLVVVIHGHEELFFEFASSEARDDCELLLLRQMDLQNREASRSDLESLDQSGVKLARSASDLTDARLRFFENKLQTATGAHFPIILEDNPEVQTALKPKKPYKFVLLTIGSRGDVQPYIVLGKGLLKEGHQVKIVTHEEFQPWIEKHGIEFGRIAGDPAELMNLMVTHGTLSVSFLKEASSKFRGWINDLLSSSWDACRDADVLIESPSAMAGIHIAEALGIPYFRAFTMPWTKTRAYPHAFIVPDQKRGGSYNYLTHVMFENVFWKGISGQVNKWRCETLHLQKTNLEHLQQSKVPFLYNISPTVFPPSVDFASWVRVTGYWFLDEGDTYTPPQEMVEFIQRARQDGKKLVYIGFGSIVVSDPKALTKAVVEAVVEADVRCILNKGWSDRLGAADAKQVEVRLPSCIYNTASVPHDWLFTQIDAAVHHGGSGTTGASLRAGLPTIIKPFFGDQFFYANRVVDLGAGLALKRLNVESLSKALKEVTSDQRIIQKAKDIGAKIRDEDGVSNALRIIYSGLEYAKKLIVSKREAAGLALDKAIQIQDHEDESWLVV